MERIGLNQTGGLEITSGGGILSVIGVPLLLGGLYLMATGMGLPTPVRPEDADVGTYLTILFVGLSLAAAGFVMIFFRQRIVFDRNAAALHIVRTMLVHFKEVREDLRNYDRIVITHIERRGKSPERFPVWLRGGANTKEVKLLDCASYAGAREQSEFIAKHLHLPLEDSTTDHAATVQADELDAVPAAGSVASLPDVPAAPRPPEMRSTLDPSLSGGIDIRIPGPAITSGCTIAAVFLTLIAFGFASGFLADGDPFELPADVLKAFGMVLVALLLVPAVNALLGKSNPDIGSLLVTVSPAGIDLTRRGLVRRWTRAIPRANILGCDYGTGMSRWQKNFGRGPGFGSTTLGSWLKRRSLARGGEGIIIKTHTGNASFGAGLPDAEIEYLFRETVQTLGS
jgi:hypothetical protein